MSKQESNEQFLSTILGAIMKKKFKPAIQVNEGKIDELYKTIQDVINDYDSSIKECKKYNEAKIHRKYEVTIGNLEKKILYLTEQIKTQRSVRSPSKKYVNELVDKMMEFKTKNECLVKENNKLKTELKSLKGDFFQIENNKKKEQTFALQRENLPPTKNHMQMESIIHKRTEKSENKFWEKDVQDYLKYKIKERRLSSRKDERTIFERFLKKSLKDLSQWNFTHFLEQIDKWSNDLAQTRNTNPIYHQTISVRKNKDFFVNTKESGQRINFRQSRRFPPTRNHSLKTSKHFFDSHDTNYSYGLK